MDKDFINFFYWLVAILFIGFLFFTVLYSHGTYTCTVNQFGDSVCPPGKDQ